ncbi:targeting protein for Xklp2-like [Vespa velutina]|uniref:targeting protein for Xklp2-like n=1 Tax=Vespa velutina TaxID=202808 RepID=UPI001FB4E565|nr:targeting protein for Xklp2-like [Vespa velutina]
METETPLSYYRFKSRPTNRQLWPKNKEGESLFKDWINRVNVTLDPWDKIDSPQFIDFFNIPELSDRFFETKEEEKPLQHSANAQRLPRTSDYNNQNELINLLDNFSLTKEKKQQLDKNIDIDKENRGEKKQDLTRQCIQVKHKTTTRENTKNITEKVHTAVKSFNFDLRNKCKQQQETFKEDKLHIFGAKPVPKFIKTLVPSKSNYTIGEKFKESNKINSEKSIKKCPEIWKKPPFLPSLTKRILKIPETPLLLTAIRAKERKRFEEKLKEKEKEMIATTEKKLEKEEIACLRTKNFHKVQPIRKYNSNLTRIEKRPLIEPLDPLNHKRRRRI